MIRRRMKTRRKVEEGDIEEEDGEAEGGRW